MIVHAGLREFFEEALVNNVQPFARQMTLPAVSVRCGAEHVHEILLRVGEVNHISYKKKYTVVVGWSLTCGGGLEPHHVHSNSLNKNT